MTKPLKGIKNKTYHIVDGVLIDGVHKDISGDVSGIYGCVTNIRGNVSGISGDVGDIRGDVSGIGGDVTGIGGNFDDIPLDARKDKPNVCNWIESD